MTPRAEQHHVDSAAPDHDQVSLQPDQASGPSAFLVEWSTLASRLIPCMRAEYQLCARQIFSPGFLKLSAVYASRFYCDADRVVTTATTTDTPHAPRSVHAIDILWPLMTGLPLGWEAMAYPSIGPTYPSTTAQSSIDAALPIPSFPWTCIPLPILIKNADGGGFDRHLRARADLLDPTLSLLNRVCDQAPSSATLASNLLSSIINTLSGIRQTLNVVHPPEPPILESTQTPTKRRSSSSLAQDDHRVLSPGLPTDVLMSQKSQHRMTGLSLRGRRRSGVPKPAGGVEMSHVAYLSNVARHDTRQADFREVSAKRLRDPHFFADHCLRGRVTMPNSSRLGVASPLVVRRPADQSSGRTLANFHAMGGRMEQEIANRIKRPSEWAPDESFSLCDSALDNSEVVMSGREVQIWFERNMKAGLTRRAKNVISFQFDHIRDMRTAVGVPTFVEALSWESRFCARPKGHWFYTQSDAAAMTQWHVDFSGTSVSILVLQGHKVSIALHNLRSGSGFGFS